MKKVKFILAALMVVAVGIGIFFACKKENSNNTDTSTAKLTQKDNPEVYNVRALYTEDTAIEMTLTRYDNGTVNISYSLSPAEPDDKFQIIIIDPDDEYLVSYNEDSSEIKSVGPENVFFYGWMWECPSNPSIITPLEPGGGLSPTNTARCVSGCTQDNQCRIHTFKYGGECSQRCENPCDNCSLRYSIWATSYNYTNQTGSLIIFEATSTITINGSIVEPGDYYTIQ